MIILDVREREEFEAEHIPDSILCPLSQFDLQAPGILKHIKNEEVIIMCRTGNRAKMAVNELKKHDSDHLTFKTYDGGIQKWKSEGKPVKGKGATFPILRQVQIIASTMIFLGFLGAQFVAPGMIYLALFVGFGLALAGYSGFCPMVFLLQKMPWNNKRMDSCNVKKNNCCD
jgi:rhodanese-related sulfurtransferase